MPKLSESDGRSLEDDVPFHESPSSGNSTSKHVVIVMDGMTQFTIELLQWTLDNVVTSGCVIILIGVMPWLNIPLFQKTRNEFWMAELEDDVKNLKWQEVIDLCRKYGVELQKKVVMGYPPQELVVEQVLSLFPTWVVFDRCT